MNEVQGRFDDNKIIMELSGRIDSNNAASVDAEIQKLVEGKAHVPVLIHADQLEYISSAGLRDLLRLMKTNPQITITGVSSDIYEIFDMTGFTQMMNVEKEYKTVSVEGCEEIGRGANGSVYKIDEDTVVKVYNNPDALEDIQHEREVARTALVLGIPTAISYEVVKVGDSYGSVFEMLNAQSFSKILSEQPEKLDWCVDEYVKMLKKIHRTIVPEGQLPDMKDTVVSWASFMKDYLPEEEGEKLLEMVNAIPRDNHMIHGDYHTKNLELQGDEVLLIDMDTLAVGHPIFELGSMFNAYIGFSELDHEQVKIFQGFDFETSKEFWRKTLEKYLSTKNEEVIRDVEDKARIIGYTRLIRRLIRRNGLESEDGKKWIEHWTKELIQLLKEKDSLTFVSGELEVEAIKENLGIVMQFVNDHLSDRDVSPKAKMQIDLAVEEIFINISSYAYAPDIGKATVLLEVEHNPLKVIITFMDRGMPYDPLAKQDPDITLPASEREIGGLGILLVKETMDDVTYEYKDGQNILRLKKNL